MPNRQFDKRYFYSSAYRRAKMLHNCGDCGGKVTRGQTYLFFVPREREHIDLCLGCSVKRNSDGSFRWPCNVVRERVWHLGDKAGEQPQGELPLTGFDDDELPEES